MIKCLICNREFKSSRGLCNHIHTHNINSMEYIEKYGDFRLDKINEKLIICPICNKYNFSNLQSHLTWKHKISKEEFLKRYPGYDLCTNEYKKQCIDAGHKSLQVQMNNEDKWKKSRKKAAKIAHKNLSNELKERWKDPKYRKRMSEKCKKQHESGNLTDKVVKYSGARIKYKDYYMRSSWEVRLAEFLDNNLIEYQYEPFYFNYIDGIGKSRKYYPDFYIEKLHLILEVKPIYQLKYDEVILKKECSINNGFNYIFITEKELFQDLNVLSKLIDDYKSNIK